MAKSLDPPSHSRDTAPPDISEGWTSGAIPGALRAISPIIRGTVSGVGSLSPTPLPDLYRAPDKYAMPAGHATRSGVPPATHTRGRGAGWRRLTSTCGDVRRELCYRIGGGAQGGASKFESKRAKHLARTRGAEGPLCPAKRLAEKHEF